MTEGNPVSLDRLVKSRLLRICVGLAISALALSLALRDVDYREVRLALSEADLRLVAGAVLGVAAANLGKAARWKVLLGAQGAAIPFHKLLLIHVAGQMFNALLPARVGDFGRAFLIEEGESGRGFILGTVFVEKLLDLLGYTALFLVLLPLVPLPGWGRIAVSSLAALAALLFAMTMILLRRKEWVVARLEALAGRLESRLWDRARKPLLAGLSSLEILRSRRELPRLLLWSAVIWGASIGINHLVLLSLGMHLPLSASLLLLVILLSGISLPSAPGRVGLFEYLCILSLAVFGIRGAPALSYAVLLHSVVLLPILVVGLAATWSLRVPPSQFSFRYRPSEK